MSAAARMPAHDAEFAAAKDRLGTIKEEPDNMVKLQIYALFKQVDNFSLELEITLKMSRLDLLTKRVD